MLIVTWEFESPPLHLIFKCGNSSVGRAQPCQGWGRGSESRFPLHLLNKQETEAQKLAQVAELVDAHVSGACVERCAGSSPVLGTHSRKDFFEEWLLILVRKISRRGGGIGRRATLRG